MLELIRQERARKEEIIRKITAGLESSLSAYWEESRGEKLNEAQLTESVFRDRQIYQNSLKALQRLKKLADSPYFARMDFREDNVPETEALYIGIGTLTDPQSGRCLVYDWRAPVAGMYYDYEPGPVSYKSPSGIIRGEILRKRQYKIADGQLIYMFDSDIRIEDDLLQELMVRSADGRMKSIVTSIQREQNRVIRDESHKVLVVQGPAGSGKTSIGLHRAAYLLYKEKDMITPENIWIFSPNHLLNDYISEVLPELGEDPIPQATFGDFATEITGRYKIKVETWDEHMEDLLSGKADSDWDLKMKSTRLKSSPEFFRALTDYIKDLKQTWVQSYPELSYRDTVLITKDEWTGLFLHSFPFLSIEKRLAKIRERIMERLLPLKKEMEKEAEQEIARTGEEVNEQVIKALARLKVREILNPLTGRIFNLTSINPLESYIAFYKDQRFRQDMQSLFPDRIVESVRRFTLRSYGRGVLPYEDSAPFLYFLGELTAFPVKRPVRHIIVDEVQDYSLIQQHYLKKVFPNAKWTFLGDIEQTLHPFLKNPDLKTTAHIFGTEETAVIRLEKSYRSTREIYEFCRQILGKTISAEGLIRHGAKPKVIKADDGRRMLSLIESEVKELEDKGYRSIAIITKTAKEGWNLFNNWDGDSRPKPVTKDETVFLRGTVIIPVYLAKGLEFDAVIVTDADRENYGRDFESRVLYVACSRALHHLSLYYRGEPSPFLPYKEGFNC